MRNEPGLFVLLVEAELKIVGWGVSVPRYELWTQAQFVVSHVMCVGVQFLQLFLHAIAPPFTGLCVANVVVPPRDVNLITEDTALGASAAAAGAG